MFPSSDGSRLVVLASKYQTYNYGLRAPGSGGVAIPLTPAYQADFYTYINVYDVTNKASLVLTRNFTVTGSYLDSRMTGNNVYQLSPNWQACADGLNNCSLY